MASIHQLDRITGGHGRAGGPALVQPLGVPLLVEPEVLDVAGEVPVEHVELAVHLGSAGIAGGGRGQGAAAVVQLVHMPAVPLPVAFEPEILDAAQGVPVGEVALGSGALPAPDGGGGGIPRGGRPLGGAPVVEAVPAAGEVPIRIPQDRREGPPFREIVAEQAGPSDHRLGSARRSGQKHSSQEENGFQVHGMMASCPGPPRLPPTMGPRMDSGLWLEMG